MQLACVCVCRTLGEEEHSSNEIKQLIDKHLRLKTEVEVSLPQQIVIGPFFINVDSIRVAMAKKHKDVARALMDFLANKLRKDADVVRTLYSINTIMCLEIYYLLAHVLYSVYFIPSYSTCKYRIEVFVLFVVFCLFKILSIVSIRYVKSLRK